MRVLVTGAAGFIGSHLSDRLTAEGHTVTGSDNLTTGNYENTGKSWNCVINDVASSLWAHWATGSDVRPDLIVHCAASYSDPEKWHRDTNTNVAGAINVAIAARALGCPVVYFQTALIYGNNPMVPEFDGGWTEKPGLPLPITQPLNPENSYAISKLAAEQYLRLSGVPLLTFRLANIYGPRNLSGPIPTFYKRLTAGEPCTVVDSRRDFVYIDDLVDLVTLAINRGSTGTYHVASGRDFSIKHVFMDVVDALGVGSPDDATQVPRGPDDAPTILLDPSKTFEDFGWQATTEIDEGIRAAVEWYQEHGVTQTFTHLKEPVT